MNDLEGGCAKRSGHQRQNGSLRNGVSQKSLVAQRLGFPTFTAKGPGSIPGQGTKIRQAMWYSKKRKMIKAVIIK